MKKFKKNEEENKNKRTKTLIWRSNLKQHNIVKETQNHQQRPVNITLAIAILTRRN